MAAVWSRGDHHCATVVSAPKMLQISNPRPEWFWYDHHILILSICLHYSVPTKHKYKYQKDIFGSQRNILMSTELLFIVRIKKYFFQKKFNENIIKKCVNGVMVRLYFDWIGDSPNVITRWEPDTLKYDSQLSQQTGH